MSVDVKRSVVIGRSSVGATSVQLSVLADSPNPDTAPPTLSLAYENGSNAYNTCVAFSVSAFTADTSVSPYNFKATLTLSSANVSTAWPAGQDGTVGIKVSDGLTGSLINTIQVTLTGNHLYNVPVTTATLTSM
jgi:hypothetical protein